MLVNIADIRTNFRVENGMPDAIIQRYIDTIENDFVLRFGNTFTDVVASPTTYPTEARLFTDVICNLVMANLLGESLVVTGFGTVVKKDEFSENVDFDETQKYAKLCAKNAVNSLKKIPNIDQREAAETITDLQGFTEAFFERRSEMSVLHKYFPYTYPY